MKRVRVVVTGRVQGVGYRYSLYIVADRAGLSGWVRNRYDGSVEAELEGTAQAVAEVLAWMLDGPPGACVEDRHVAAREPTGAKGFRVLGDA
ncbi:MAG TPA: acylphosphatase [Arachnia sp.]|nr:acylphosphatase [Arachnia sp.]HMT85459.1 acylphosphatase [Arachnia sp.]